MRDIKAIRTYWEHELTLESGRHESVPIIRSPARRTWIWSDLHLSDPGPFEVFKRPFPSVEAMNRHLLGEWRRLVGVDDTIICLGDVGHPDAWRDRELMERLRGCPGRRVLIVGNHDHDRRALAEAGFEVQHERALYDAEPVLALTHAPLSAVPVGAVNVHGHLHEGTEWTYRHVNFAVERWTYRPVSVAEIARRAAAKRGDP